MRWTLIVARFAGFTLLVLGVASCARQEPRPTTYPVNGQVLFEGKKCGGAVVIFHPLNQTAGVAVRPRGRSDGSGEFLLSTFGRDDGAPAGEYAVVIEWKKETDHPEQGLDLLPSQYGDPKQTPVRVTVKAEPTELAPFRLTR